MLRKQTILLLAGLFLPMPGARVLAGARDVKIPLEIESGQGCVFDARSAHLLDKVPVQDSKGRITIEAERASRYFLHPSRWQKGAPLPDDPDASGKYLADVIYARYDFRVDRAGKFAVWLRISPPEGKSRLRNLIDGRWYMTPFYVENKEDPLPFRWVQRGTLALGKGWHFYELTRYASAFPRIDRLLFQPAGLPAPEGTGPMEALEENRFGLVTTPSLSLPGLLSLTRLGGVKGPGIDASVSADEGKTWTDWMPAPSDVNSIALPALNVEEETKVRFRFRLARKPGKPSPRLRGIWLEAQMNSASCIELENGTSRLLFDRRTGGLLLAECTKTGDVVVGPGQPRPLAAVIFKKVGEGDRLRVTSESRALLKSEPGRRKGLWALKPQVPEMQRVSPSKVKVGRNRLEVEFLFQVPFWGKAKLRYSVKPAGRKTWDFTVVTGCIEGPADVVGVVFPIWEHVRIGSSGLDDHQLRLQSFGHHTWHPGNRPIRDERYFGGVVMPWTEVHDGNTGFYVGAHDASATNVLFESRAGGPAAEYFSMSTTKLDNIHPGESRSYTYAVSIQPGDWHPGADLYRKWFLKTFGHAKYPDWLRETRGWIALQAENYGRSFRFNRIPDLLTRARAVGLDWVQVWGQFAYDGGPCCSAIYPPSPLYGGAEGWAEAVGAVTRRGGHVGGYFVNDRIDFLPRALNTFLGHFGLDTYPEHTRWPSPDFLDQVRLITDPSGALPPFPPSAEQVDVFRKRVAEHEKLYAEGKRAKPIQWWAKTYLNDPVWWDFLKFWIVDKYEKEYGCNTAYIDVLGTGSCQESFDPRRNHNGDGGYSRGKWQLTRHVVQAAQRVNPDFAVTQEGLGDLTGLYCAPMASGIYRGGRNIYRYTFPGRVLIHGATNPGSGGSTLDRFLETFLEGMRFDIVGRTTALPLYLMHLHEQFLPELYYARFMDTVGLEVSTPRVQARWFRLKTRQLGGAFLTLVNRGKLAGEKVRLRTEDLGEVRAGFLVNDGGAAGAIKLKHEKNAVEFEVPDALASMIYLSGKTPSRAVPRVTFYLKRSSPPEGRLTLFNPSGKVQKGRCALRIVGLTEPLDKEAAKAVAALPFVRTERSFSLGPGEARTLSFPLRTLRNHDWTVQLSATVTTSHGRPRRRQFLVTPFVLDGSWEITGQPDESAADGKQSRALGPTTAGYQHDLLDLWLEPSKRYRLEIKAKRTGFTAAVQGTLLMVQTPDNPRAVWVLRGLDRARPNQWQTISYEFETPAEMVRAGLYLYNVRSPDTAWFDDLEVEEIGPVRPRP